MKLLRRNCRSLAKLTAVCAASLLAASSASAAIVWDLNPDDQNAAIGTTQTFTSSGYEITARGYINNGGEGTPTELYFKDKDDSGGASEHGLGLAYSPHNELNGGSPDPANFIQLDLRSILSQGFTNGQIAVASLQEGESFQLFGSDIEGQLGVAISIVYTGLTFDDEFVAIADFGMYDFISVVGVGSNSNVLPSQFRAEITPIPEMSALLPIVGLLAAVGATTFLRRRRAAASV